MWAAAIYGLGASWRAWQGERGGAALDSYTVVVQSLPWMGEEDDVMKEMMALTHEAHLSRDTRSPTCSMVTRLFARPARQRARLGLVRERGKRRAGKRRSWAGWARREGEFSIFLFSFFNPNSNMIQIKFKYNFKYTFQFK